MRAAGVFYHQGNESGERIGYAIIRELRRVRKSGPSYQGQLRCHRPQSSDLFIKGRTGTATLHIKACSTSFIVLYLGSAKSRDASNAGPRNPVFFST